MGRGSRAASASTQSAVRGARATLEDLLRAGTAVIRRMPHPELLLRDRLKSALALAFGAEHQETDPLLRRSDRAHYQVNVAMSLGKALRRPPREVAQTL